jgi:hypothetical protein
MGFECRPPAGIPSARPLPEAEASFGPTLPSADSRSTLMVSHHLDGFLRARVTGLLHPATSQGFAAFHACRRPAPPEGGAIRRVHSPRRGSHPSKTSPRQQPYRITAAVAFLSLPSCPARFPTEVGVLADRHTPRRVTYTCDSLPWLAGPACPEGREVRCRRGIAPKGGVTLPARWGARDSEEPLVPCPGEAPLATPRRVPSALPRGRGPIPVRLGARCSEERRLPGPVRRGDPDPVGTGAPLLRRGSVSLSRWGGAPSTPKSRWFPVPVRLAGRLSEECRLPGPVERVRPCSEEREVACPGAVRRAVLRRAPSTVPRWVGALPQSKRGLTDRSVPSRPRSEELGFPCPARFDARCSEEPRLSDLTEVRRAMLRRASSA